MQIRDERDEEDAAAISRVTAAAFANAPHSSGTEARIVAALRQAGALTISLAAVSDDGSIVGHVAFSPVQIDRTAGRWYGLGPISVVPEMQRQGIGRALIREDLARLAAINASGCVLLGDPAYYSRFGFVSDPALTYAGEPSPYFQRLLLRGDPPNGDVSYHRAFDVR
ncbi:N-acetyltransferase [Bradyrhizobium quebecense]|uniref:N-acetyltransferase n=1 Tax=Bradyrhizobium quebecense TaxID=2748629 RepID=A0A974AIY6_9BRAD|nr:N-acetyltransferase [Bradyrhizobium quebecense]UGA44485.1 N-acetyltransferase [Bradyrhizobium quebecense]